MSDGMNKMAAVVAGVGPDAPTKVNEQGGRQSDSPYRADLTPPLAFLAVSAVLKHGAEKYGVDNWHAISVREHLNHALVHAFAHLAGDRQDGHLEHFACRALMALEIALMADRSNPPARAGDLPGPASVHDTMFLQTLFDEVRRLGMFPPGSYVHSKPDDARRLARGIVAEVRADAAREKLHEGRDAA